MRAVIARVRADALDHAARRDRRAAPHRRGRCGDRPRRRRRQRSHSVRQQSRRHRDGRGRRAFTNMAPIRPDLSAEGLAIAARAGALMGDLEFVQFHPTALDDARIAPEADQRDGARRRRDPDQRPRASLHGRRRRRRTRAARCRRARGPRAARRWPSRLSRRAAGHRRALRAALSGGRRLLPRGGNRSRDAADPDPSGGALSHGRHQASILPDAARSKGFGPAARRPARACTAPTGSPAIRCWRPSFAADFVAESIASTCPPRRRKLVTDLPALRQGDLAPVRKIMSRAVGVLRNGEGLREAAAALFALARDEEAANDAAVVGLMIAVAALRREESRGRACANRLSRRRGEGAANDLAPFRRDARRAPVCARTRRLSASERRWL